MTATPKRESDDTHERRGRQIMDAFIGTFAVFVFVIGVLAVFARALFEVGPFR